MQRNPTVKAEIQLRGFSENTAEGDTTQRQGIPVGFLSPVSMILPIVFVCVGNIPLRTLSGAVYLRKLTKIRARGLIKLMNIVFFYT